MSFARRLPQVLAVTVVAGLLGLLIWDLANSHAGKIARDVDEGKAVPAFDFSRPQINASGNLSLPSLRGKVVVVNFWQSYCEPCHTEARTLESVSNQWKGKDVVFVGIDEIDLVSAAKAFMKRYGVTYPTVSDDGPLVGRYGVTGYPETFFIDRQGQVVPINVGNVHGHIVGPASKQLLNQGIRQALKA